jgi:hypothetical protein
MILDRFYIQAFFWHDFRAKYYNFTTFYSRSKSDGSRTGSDTSEAPWFAMLWQRAQVQRQIPAELSSAAAAAEEEKEFLAK